jgi:glycosyltransferase involved in cell wall biosynthesis
LRIAVDADNLYRFPHRGIAKTTVPLYRHLATTYPHWEFVLFRQVGEPLEVFNQFPNITQRQIDIKGDSLPGRLWEQVRLPLAAWLAGADVLHASCSTGPAFSRVPLVVTIHDLTPIRFSPDLPSTWQWYRRVKRAARRADVVITGSQVVADDLSAEFGLEPARIAVAHWAVNDGYRNAPVDTAPTLASYGADTRPFVMVFGSRSRHKNLSRILEAWAGVPSQVREQWQLLVIGVEPDGVSSYRAETTRLGIEDSTKINGAVPEAHIPALLRAAEILCYPSLAEGFGLPVIEAFACGTSVLTSNTTSLPEVAGDAALLVDPTSAHELTAGLTLLMTDVQLREKYVAAGHRRLELFTWERCVKVHANAFERAART